MHKGKMKYLFLTDAPDVAAFVQECGVARVFIDLEQIGKVERQGGQDTVISQHDTANVSKVKSVLKSAECLVRTNPLHAGSRSEIDHCIDSGADLLMLPMFRSAQQLRQYCKIVDGRVPVVPLIETRDALADVEAAIEVPGVSDVHFGLNDLRIDLGLSFLFEVVARGLLDHATEVCRAAKMPFGIGGVGRIGHGMVPGDYVLGEYVRLGANATILSRAFHERAANLADLNSKVDLPTEMDRLVEAEARLQTRTSEEIESDRQRFCDAVDAVVKKVA